MPTVSLNPTFRFLLYIVAALGSAVAAYLFAKGLVGDAELGLWAAVVAIINGIAAANTNTGGDHKADVDPAKRGLTY